MTNNRKKKLQQMSQTDTSFRLLDMIILCALLALFTFFCGKQMIYLTSNGLGRSTTDMANVNQAIWNTAHGAPLQSTILYEGIRDHYEPALIFYSLNYLLGGTINTLLYLHTFLIGLGAIPFYLMARKRIIPRAGAIAIACTYLLLPAIHQMISTNYLRPDLLFFPTISLMAYAITFSDRKLIAISAILALLCKESGALAVLGLGIYCIIFRKDLKMGIILTIIGIFWMPFISMKLLPWIMGFTTKHSSRIRSLSINQLTHIYHIGWPIITAGITILLLCRRRWASLVTLPHNIFLFFFVARLRYTAASIPIVFFLAVDEICQLKYRLVKYALLCIIPLLFLGTDVKLKVWQKYPPNKDIQAALPLIAMIPPDAKVCADDQLLVHLSTRRTLYAFNRKHYHTLNNRDYIDAEYFLIRRNKKEKKPGSVRRHRRHSSAIKEFDTLNTEKLAESSPWTLYRQE